MLLTLWLSAPALSFTPPESGTHAGLPVGLPVTHLARDPTIQRAWEGRSAELRARWGPWAVRWDQRNATPRALIGQGIPTADLDDLVAEIARMGGVDPSDLVFTGAHTEGEGASWHYTQTWRGAPIMGSGVHVYAEAGSINGAFASLHRPDLGREPAAGERVLALEGDDGRLRYHLVTTHDAPHDVVELREDGRLVYRYTTRRHLDVTLLERTIDDGTVQEPARDVQVDDGSTVVQTADDGSHGLSGALDVDLSGAYLSIYEHYGNPARAYGVDDEVLDGGVDITLAAATNLHHFHVVRDWLEDRRPAHPWLGDVVPATVNITDATCNAYYTGGTINFYVGDDVNCYNFGQIADVVYHEYGHGIHDYVLEGGTFASDVSEGSADFVSATILDDPTLAPNAKPDGAFIREIDSDKRYPDDAIGQSHNDGLIWASFLWNLRDQWIADMGYDDGTRAVDELFLEALSHGPELTDLYEAVLLSDDDDGDLSNSTPHACELLELLDEHGLGPGALGLVLLNHTPLDTQDSASRGYALTFSLFDVTPDCGGFDPDSARLGYTVNGEAGDFYDYALLTPERDGNNYTATIPRQLPGSEVTYFIAWQSEDGTAYDTSHGEQERGLYSFRVGDREPLWCDDFEDGWGEWTHGPGEPYSVDNPGEWHSEWEIGIPPGNQGFMPANAYSGDHVLGTDVLGNGQYDNNNAQYVLSPEIALSAEDIDERLFLLTARRYLTVEDGYYDQAQLRIYQDGAYQVLWDNYASPSRDGAHEHTLDEGWIVDDHDLLGWIDLERPVQFAWLLRSDAGLEFGGWTLDDVCVVTLADPPRHYRADDLRATDDEDAVRITWTQPFIDPLSHTALVRNRDGWPTSVLDGEILDMRVAPTIGAEMEVVDADVAPGEVAYYALFAAAEGQAFYAEAVEGENADVGGVPAIEEPEPEDTGDTAPPEETEEPDPVQDEGDYVWVPYEHRWSCAAVPGSGSAGYSALLALALVAGARRRRDPRCGKEECFL